MKPIQMKKIARFIHGGIFMLVISISSNTFAFNDSSQPLIPATTARNQYLLVDSQNPTGASPSTGGISNQTIVCGPNEQLVGIIESNTGGGSNPGYQPYARSNYPSGNYTYVPRCRDPSYWTGSCDRDWVQEYTRIDTMQLVCAKNSMLWQNLNEHPNPDSKSQAIGSYTAPPVP